MDGNERVVDGGVLCILYRNGQEVDRQEFIGGERAVYETVLEEPEWCQLTVVGLDAEGERILVESKGGAREVLGCSGAVANPLELRQGAPEPEDFDEYWSAERARMEKVSSIPIRRPVEGMPSHLRVEYVEVPVGGGFRAANGVLRMPSSAEKGSLLIQLHLHGSGVHNPANPGWAPPIPQGAGVSGPVIFFNLNAHGLPNDEPSDFYSELREGELKNYPYLNSEDR